MDKSLKKNISKLALGTAQFGMDYGIANLRGRIRQEEIDEILAFANKSGIQTLDTAQTYGCSEAAIGAYFALNPDDYWQIVTKVSPDFGDLADSLGQSEERLTVRPHALLAHSADLFLQADFQSQIQIIRSQRLVDAVGVSLYTESEIEQVLKAEYRPDIVQLPVNILDTRVYHSGILREISEQGIELHARSVFLQGFFYLSKAELERRFPDVCPVIEQLRSIASEAGLQLPELSLLWLMSRQEISKVIVGVDSLVQLKSHLGTLKKEITCQVFEAALAVRFENSKILNPSNW